LQVKHRLAGAIFAQLTTEEKQYATSHHLVMVKGKRNLTPDLKVAMDLLVATRLVCSVLPSNNFMFAIPGFSSFINQSNVLGKFKFDVANMDTRLVRHFLATIIQAAPNAIPVDQLANHMGHSISVHREFYR
jgi:hypothetical protein